MQIVPGYGIELLSSSRVSANGLCFARGRRWQVIVLKFECNAFWRLSTSQFRASTAMLLSTRVARPRTRSVGPSPRQDSAKGEEEARPLRRDELTARTIRGLHKREANETKYREQRRNKRLVANKGQL